MATSLSTVGLALAAPLSAEVANGEFRASQNVAGQQAKLISSCSTRQNSLLHRVATPGASGQHRSSVVAYSANLNDVAVTTPGAAPAKPEDPEVPALADEASASGETAETSPFISDVANLIKLVDSRDIVELEVKHKKYEILIRKKEAVKWDSPPQQTQPGLHVMAHSGYPQYYSPPPPAPAPQAAPEAAAPPPPAAAAPAAAPAKAASGSLPMLSPMAGTFYRSPAPGEPPIVKVGDKVTKGQVVCIVEAMKLMNEIECDQTGTISEILLNDASPVTIDTPIFSIRP